MTRDINIIKNNFFTSEKYRLMVLSDKYYNGKHDILNRVKNTIDSSGNLVEIKNVPNYKIVDNMYRDLLDQKVNYILSKPLTLDCINQEYLEKLKEFIKIDFLRTLFLLGKDCYKYGIGWLYIYLDKKGNLKFKRFNSKEIIPIWADKEHTELEKVYRVYKDYDIENNYTLVDIVEEYTRYCVKKYTNGKEEMLYYFSDGSVWDSVPIIPFKCNDDELGLLSRIKDIQDRLNETFSDFKNDMEQNWRNTIFVVKGYNPEGEKFRYNLSLYGVVGLEENADLETITVDVNKDNYESLLKQCRETIIRNGRGFNAKEEILGHDPNQMNIQSMYSNIDLDSNEIEIEFTYSFNKLLEFINRYLYLTSGINYDGNIVKILFNRDIMINETQAINNCMVSSTLISRETMLSRHPWISDTATEIKRIDSDDERERKTQEKLDIL